MSAGTAVLQRPVVQATVSAMAAAVLVHAAVTGNVRSPGVVLAVIVAGVVSGLLGALRPWRRLAGVTPGDPRDLAGLLAAHLLGVLPLAPFFVLAVDVPLGIVSPLFAAVLLTGVFAHRSPLREWFAAVSYATYVLTVLWAGERDPGVLVLAFGGAALTVAAGIRLADALARSIETAADERGWAEARARLLAALARTNTLEPEAVLQQAARGLLDVGFDVVTVRIVTPDGTAARLVGSATTAGLALDEEVPIVGSLFEEAARTGAIQLLTGERLRTFRRPVESLVVVPVEDDGEVVAFVTAGRERGLPRDDQLEAVRLLADHATVAMRRARAFELDRQTVEELRALDLRAHDFVSTVSHELRTPLTVVKGLAQTLAAHWDQLPPDRREDLLARIESNADRLGDMVGSLLDSSTLGSGALDPSPVPVRLREAVGGLVHRLAPVAEHHPCHLDVPDDVVVHADPRLLAHVLENLLTNVAKHTPRGTPVRVSAVTRGDEVEVTVADEGPGIAASDLPHILDRFYRGGDPDRRASGGLGLGLALAAEIVRAHGGDLRVDSEVGRGTRFTFAVPAAAAGSG